MNPVFLLAEVQSGGQIEKIARTFGVDWSHLIAQIISFCIVCALLYWWAYQPILKMLAERRRQITQGLANTEKIKAELARTEAQRQEVMLKANAEATKIIDEAHTAAARVQQNETQKAIAAAEQIVVKAQEATEQDYARMLSELKREVGRLVIQTTASLTGKILTTEDQRRLAEETAKQLPS
jgi:F-type H+-transporting ATPase subunit b